MTTPTRERVLEQAAVLLRRQGPAATGVLEVLQAARAPRGSLYHHFPGGKSQLVVEALARGAEQVTRQLQALAASPAPTHEVVRHFVEGMADALERSAFRDGCPVATAALEAAGQDDAVAEVTAASYAAWQSVLRERLAADDVEDADDVAEQVLVAVEGALVLARARRDASVLRRTARRLADDVARSR